MIKSTFANITFRNTTAYKEFHTDENIVPRDFVREVNAYANLTHEYLCNLLAMDIGPTQCILSIPRAPTDLRHYINNTGRLPSKTRRCFTKQLLCGVTYIHKQGYMHRDLKPSNILVFSSPLVAKISDFGTCIPYIEGRANTIEIGTPNYRAHDCSTEFYTPDVDWFALGLIINEFFAKYSPRFKSPDEFVNLAPPNTCAHYQIATLTHSDRAVRNPLPQTRKRKRCVCVSETNSHKFLRLFCSQYRVDMLAEEQCYRLASFYETRVRVEDMRCFVYAIVLLCSKMVGDVDYDERNFDKSYEEITLMQQKILGVCEGNVMQ